MTGYVFGEKHREYMRRALRCTFNVAEGSVRAGKTVDNVFVFASLLESAPDRLHLATGATVAAARLNIADCNGLGLEKLFAGRYRWCSIKGCDCMKISTRTGEKCVVFAGGKNADAYKRIRGNSYGMWIATEINLHHDSMIKEAMNRQLAARGRRVFWDMNPTSPSAAVYRDYLDLYRDKASRGELPPRFYNYEHFTIRDNPTVSEARLREIEAQYDPGSVWYRRDILGERCAAEGLVYSYFVENRSELTPARRDVDEASIRFITLGVDFGGNRSKSAFAACAHMADGSLCIVADGEIGGAKGEVDPARLNVEFLAFVSRVREYFPSTAVRYAFCDSEAQYLINGLRRAVRESGEQLELGESKKCPIRDRIDFVTSMMASDRFKVCRECESLIRALSEAQYDPESTRDVRLDNFTSDIDILDAAEYSFERYMRALSRR